MICKLQEEKLIIVYNIPTRIFKQLKLLQDAVLNHVVGISGTRELFRVRSFSAYCGHHCQLIRIMGSGRNLEGGEFRK